MATITQTRTNLATDPSFETPGVTFTVRNNLLTNPRATTTNSWGQNAGTGGTAALSNVSTGGPSTPGVPTFNRVTWSVATTSPSGNIEVFPPAPTVGTAYSASMQVRPSRTQPMRLQIDWNGASGYISSSSGPLVTVAANMWTQLTVPNAVAPAGATSCILYAAVDGTGTNWAVNDTLDGTAALWEASTVVMPYFDGSTPPYLRTNLALDPEGTATTNWVGMGNGGTSTAVDSVTFHTGTTSIKGTCTAVGGGVTGLGVKVGSPGFVTGDTIVWSMWVYPSITLTAQPYWERETGAYTAGNGGGGINCPANTWTLVTGTYTFTAGQANPGDTFHFGFITGSVPQNTTINADTVLVERNAPSGGSYFNGGTATASGYAYGWSGPANGSASYQYDADYTYAWSGPSNASSSWQQAMSFAGGGGTTAGLCASFQSTRWSNSRAKSVRIIALSSSQDTFAEIGNMFSGYAFLPNTTYTLSAVRYVSAPLTGASGTLARANIGSELNVTTIQAPPNNGAGRMVVQFTTGSNTTLNFIRLYSSAPYGGGDVWFDDVLLEKGAVSAANSTYFDGASSSYSPAGYSPPATWSFSWSSGADASTSIAQLSVPLQDYQVQLPDNTILGGSGTPFGYLEVTGLRGSASTRSADVDRAGVDGQAPGMSLLTGRTVGIKWLIAAPSIGTEAALQYLINNWQNTNDPTTVVMTARDYLLQLAGGGSKPVSMLEFQLPGRSVPVLAFGKPGKLSAPVNSGYQFGWLEVDADWVVPDGKIYDATVNTASATLPTASGSGAAFPWPFPVNFGPSTGGTLQVSNGGKYPSKPVFKITGPVMNPKITNPATGQFIRINLTLMAGDVLVVDADSRVVRLNGVNRNSALDPGSSFFTIPPGGTSLSFSSTDGGSVAGAVTVYTLNTYSAF